MKKILLFSIFILVISCSDEEKNLSVPDYMKEVFDANLNCSENDFLDLNINDQNLNYEYTTNSGLVLCSFAQGNSGGINCQNCEGHFASLSMPMDSYDSYFQGIPIQPGMEWEIQNEQIPITEINMTGLNVRINVPENLTENIEIGSYYLSENASEKGVNLFFNWEIVFDGTNNYYGTGYNLNIDKNKPYNININCIEIIIIA